MHIFLTTRAEFTTTELSLALTVMLMNSLWTFLQPAVLLGVSNSQTLEVIHANSAVYAHLSKPAQHSPVISSRDKCLTRQ